MRIDKDELAHFLKELKELSDKHNIYIDSEGSQSTSLIRGYAKEEYYYDVDEYNSLLLEEV